MVGVTSVLSDEQDRLVKRLCENELQSLSDAEVHDDYRERVEALRQKVSNDAE